MDYEQKIKALTNTINILSDMVKKLTIETEYLKKEIRSQEKYNNKMFSILSKDINHLYFRGVPSISEAEAEELSQDNTWLNNLIDFVNSRSEEIDPFEFAEEEYDAWKKEKGITE